MVVSYILVTVTVAFAPALSAIFSAASRMSRWTCSRTFSPYVHYIIHFRRNLSTGLFIEDSTRESLNNAGGPMMATSIALTLAFLVFSLSTFVPVAHFGLLSAFIMGVDLVANIFLLPALMLTRRLWNR
jgi:hypothetical protein